MKIFKFTALAMAAVLALTPAIGCKHNVKSESSAGKYADHPEVGEIKVTANVSQEAEANETGFTLNKVIDAGAQGENGEHYYYLDVTIRNTTDQEYTLGRLNNFYLILKDGTELSSDVRTELYALNYLTGRYCKSPFTVPANGTFSGIVSGFVLSPDKTDFTIGFFPTRADVDDKKNVILVPVTPSDIVPITDDLKK